MWCFYRRFPFVSKNNLDLHLKFTKYLIHIISVIISVGLVLIFLQLTFGIFSKRIANATN